MQQIDFSDTRLYNEKYMKLLHCTKRYLFLMGGSGSGKSVFVAQKEIINTFRKNQRLMVVRKVKDTHKDSTFSELKGIVEKWDLQKFFKFTESPLKIENIMTGSDIIFRGMDDPEKVKSVSKVNRVWCEEATELTREDFNQLDLRLRGKTNMQMTCSFNPIDVDHWLNLEWWRYGNTEDAEFLHTTFLDNKFAGPEYFAVMERLKNSDPNYYKIYALGEWGKREGIIFSVNIREVPENAELIGYGLDWGYTNDPTALIEIWRLGDDLFFREVVYRTGLLNSQLLEIMRQKNILRTQKIVADSADPKSIEEIHRSGFFIVPAKKGADSIQFGIDALHQYNLNVSPCSKNLQKEFSNYCWMTDKTGKATNTPIDAFNHGIDAIRYGVSEWHALRSQQSYKPQKYIGIVGSTAGLRRSDF